MFSNRFDDLINIFDKKDIISCHQIRNMTRFWLPDIEKNSIAGHFEIKQRALERNKVAGHSEIEERATKRNGVTEHFEIHEEIEDVNKDISKDSFLNQGIIKYNS